MSTSTVTVSVRERWVRRLRSPVFTLAQTLSAVSITFAPLFLYNASDLVLSPPMKVALTIGCFTIIYLVPLFYMRFAQSIIRQIPHPNALRSDA